MWEVRWGSVLLQSHVLPWCANALLGERRGGNGICSSRSFGVLWGSRAVGLGAQCCCQEGDGEQGFPSAAALQLPAGSGAGKAGDAALQG